jgi:glutathione peroxidase
LNIEPKRDRALFVPLASMSKRLLFALASSLAIPGCDARVIDVAASASPALGIYAHDCADVHGNPAGLAQFRGQVVLIVNVASHCGYTGQYRDLQALHARYADRGFAVVGFPCNDFGGQEPGDADAITACAVGYGADFPLMEKVIVKAGPNQSSIYGALAQSTGALPRWNFGKYLIDTDGQPVAFFGTRVEPLDEGLTGRIDALLPTHR